MTSLYEVFRAIRADEGDHVGKCCSKVTIDGGAFHKHLFTHVCYILISNI
jgi:hypothetical protein